MGKHEGKAPFIKLGADGRKILRGTLKKYIFFVLYLTMLSGIAQPVQWLDSGQVKDGIGVEFPSRARDCIFSRGLWQSLETPSSYPFGTRSKSPVLRRQKLELINYFELQQRWRIRVPLPSLLRTPYRGSKLSTGASLLFYSSVRCRCNDM